MFRTNIYFYAIRETQDELLCKTNPISKQLNEHKTSYDKALRQFSPPRSQPKQTQFKPNQTQF